jgi:hypothetical protein
MQTTGSLIQFQADHVIEEIRNLGYVDQKLDSKYTISIYVPKSERLSELRNIISKLPGSIHDTSYSGSSVGAIRYKGGTIKIRPSGFSGDESAGISNELLLVKYATSLASSLSIYPTINITGKNNISLVIPNICKLHQVGGDTADRKKADVIITCKDNEFKLSLKKESAQYWESADSYFGEIADEIITRLLAYDKISLLPTTKIDGYGNPVMKLSNEIAVKATPEEAYDVIFGSDLLLGNSAVLKQTFTDECFSIQNDMIDISCDTVITQLSEVDPSQEVYFLIRNDSTRRRPKHMYPGIRVVAAYRSRISQKTLIVER